MTRGKFTVMGMAFALMLTLSAGAGLEASKVSWGTIPGVEGAKGEKTPDQEVFLYTLANSKGMKAAITNYGGIVVSLEAPDRDGHLADVVLGFDSLEEYMADSPYFGCIAGRYANRIAKGRFRLDGEQYQLATNNDGNHLHGGNVGFDKVVWDGELIKKMTYVSLKLTRVSPDGEEGYPGELHCTVTYTLTNSNALVIEYEAITKATTIVNLTHHSYFNLAGQGEGDILGHELMIDADQFTPVDSTLIPTGEIAPVAGTPMDFRKPTAIGARIKDNFRQLFLGNGYDHNYVLNNQAGRVALAATAYEPTTGRFMEVWTNEPGLQFYSGNFLDGSLTGKDGKVYQQRYGFCLEAQHFPDTPNQPNFPSVELRRGQRYTQRTEYRFSAR